ncbi:MAG: hypothetical protein WCE88_07245 [Burkholderiales bacterium]
MKNKFLLPLLFAATSFALCAGIASAQQQDAPATAQTMPPQVQQGAMPEAAPGKRTKVGASFVSGGISADEKAGMRAIAKDYNFKLAFMTTGAGKPLGNVKLKVLNVKNGKPALSGTSDGACIFANLPQGSYRVLTERHGVKMDRTVKVTSKSAPGTIFYSGKDQKKNKSGCW